MEPLQDGQIKTAGELRRSAEFSRRRLKTERYACENLIQHSEYSWPGDFEGRTLLAKVSIARTLGLPVDFDAELNVIAGNVNEDGYFGARFDGETMNEQQISGNSWLMRGLCEYVLLNGDRRAEDLLRRMTESWLLRIQPFYERYPVQDEARAEGVKGEAIGALYAGVADGWRLSTDTGCAFIALDGITQVAEVLNERQLNPLIETMIASFLRIDKVGLKCQTHATLSATRGIVRYFERTKRKEYLATAVATERTACPSTMPTTTGLTVRNGRSPARLSTRSAFRCRCFGTRPSFATPRTPTAFSGTRSSSRSAATAVSAVTPV